MPTHYTGFIRLPSSAQVDHATVTAQDSEWLGYPGHLYLCLCDEMEEDQNIDT
jgi:hypothetical protein